MKHFVNNNSGQSLIEYTLVVLLVTLVFWVGIKNTNIADALANSWTKITTCVTSPFSCENK